MTRIWELRDRRLTVFRGDYSAYHRQRLERDARAAKDADSQAGSIEREKELVQRYRSHRKFSKMHEHEARLERLQAERVETPKATRKLRLPAASSQAAARPAPARSWSGSRISSWAICPDAGAGGRRAPATEAKRVARAPFLAAQRGDRIGIVGPNGAGKTTLLRTIAGDLPPIDGRLSFGNAVQIGYLAQLRDAAIPGATVIDALLEAIPITPGEARGYLARFLFRGDDAFKEVRALSGGERSRLELALLGIMPSNLLLLDEPTNHLDIPAREAIEAFMTESPATLLVVSHDRRLLETICTKLWVVDGGLAAAFDGGYREWRAAVAGGWTVAEAAAATAGGERRGPAPRSVGRRWPRRRSRAPDRRTAAGRAARRRASEARQALEGRISAPEGASSTRTSAGSGYARAISSWRWPIRPSPRTSSSSAHLQRARRRRPAWRTPNTLAGARGAGAVTRPRPPAPDRHHRADRLRQVHGRGLARRAGARSSSTPTSRPRGRRTRRPRA